MARPTILLLSFLTSILILILFAIFCFTPLSPSPPLVSIKALSSIFHHNTSTNTITQLHGRHKTDVDREEEPDRSGFDGDVVVLTKNNFTEFISRNRYVMVKFYAPWCHWSQKLAPEYAAAATLLKSRAVLAQVDCTAQPELARKFKIQGYPTVYLFVGGDQNVLYQFFGQRTRDRIANWVYSKMNNVVHNLTSVDEAERVLASKSLLVLGFLHSLQGEESEELAAVAKQNIDVNFYQTANADVAKLFHIEPQAKCPALVILERQCGTHTHANYEGQFTRLAIADFVSTYKSPSVIKFTIEESPKIFRSPMKQLWLFAPEHSWKVISVFKQAANMFKGKLLFIHVDTSEDYPVGRHLSYEFGIAGVAPTVVAYQTATNGEARKLVHHGELTLSSIKSFATEFAEDMFSSKADPSTEIVIRLPFKPHPSTDPSYVPHEN